MSGDVRSRNSLSGLNSLGQTVPLCKKIYLELEQLRKIVYNMTLGLFIEISFCCFANDEVSTDSIGLTPFLHHFLEKESVVECVKDQACN
jgi:hypothetical protein